VSKAKDYLQAEGQHIRASNALSVLEWLQGNLKGAVRLLSDATCPTEWDSQGMTLHGISEEFRTDIEAFVPLLVQGKDALVELQAKVATLATEAEDRTDRLGREASRQLAALTDDEYEESERILRERMAQEDAHGKRVGRTIRTVRSLRYSLDD
jgi:hypothetical protein